MIKERLKPFRAGMLFKSNTCPQFDCRIDFVYFNYEDDNSLISRPQIINWSNTNKEAFDKFCETHCKNKGSFFPYPFWGECNIKNFKSRLKKYDLEFSGFSGDEIIIYADNGFEFCEGFKK